MSSPADAELQKQDEKEIRRIKAASALVLDEYIMSGPEIPHTITLQMINPRPVTDAVDSWEQVPEQR